MSWLCNLQSACWPSRNQHLTFFYPNHDRRLETCGNWPHWGLRHTLLKQCHWIGSAREILARDKYCLYLHEMFWISLVLNWYFNVKTWSKFESSLQIGVLVRKIQRYKLHFKKIQRKILFYRSKTILNQIKLFWTHLKYFVPSKWFWVHKWL